MYAEDVVQHRICTSIIPSFDKLPAKADGEFLATSAAPPPHDDVGRQHGGSSRNISEDHRTNDLV